MKRLVLVLMLVVSLCGVCSARERASFVSDDEVKAEAERGFGEILDLWHNSRYDDLYEKTLSSGRQTRKGFAGRLAGAPYKPACCWRMVQDVKVTVKNDANVVVHAKIGLDGVGEPGYVTRSFKLRKEEGVWRISRADIFSLAGASKKKGYTGTIR